MEKTFRWAFIGAGYMAKKAAESISASPHHQIVSVYSRSFERAKKFAEEVGAVAFGTLEEAVDRPDVDGVYIATTHNCHYEHAKRCLTLGKPLLVEKAFTVNAKETKELFALAAQKQLYIAEAMWTWFSPVSLQVKDWVAHDIGEVEHVTINYTMFPSFLSRLTDPACAGGALLDIGVYPITYCYNLFGMPAHIKCQGRLENGIDIEETITLSYENGLNIEIFVAINHDSRVEELVIEGTKGRIDNEMYHMSKEAVFTRSDGEKIVYRGNGDIDNEFHLVADEIQRGLLQSAYVPPTSTIDCMEIMDECRRQMGLRYTFE